MSDPSGFRPDSSDGYTRASDDDVAASFATMSSTNKYNYQEKHKYDAIVSTVKNAAKNTLAASADDKVIKNLAAKNIPKTIILGVNRGVKRGVGLPTAIIEVGGVTKGARVLSKAGILGIGLTAGCVWDNYHNGYSDSEAFGRSAIDALGTAFLVALAFSPVGLGGMIAATVIVTVGSEFGKGFIYKRNELN